MIANHSPPSIPVKHLRRKLFYHVGDHDFGLFSSAITLFKRQRTGFLRIPVDDEYNPFRSTSVNLIRKPKCFFNLTYPSGSMLLWYERAQERGLAMRRLVRIVTIVITILVVYCTYQIAVGGPLSSTFAQFLRASA